MNEEKYIGYLKYSGELVEDGLMDARKSAQALLGLDEAIRLLVGQQAPELRYLDYEFPVRIKHNSWEALIPDTVCKLVIAGLSIPTAAYLTTAAKKMAEKDFDDIGLKDVFSKALKSIQWFIRIGKHLGDVTKRKFEGLKWQKDNREVGIPNVEGQYLFIPREYFDLFLSSPPKLISHMAELIEDKRLLTIGVYETEALLEEVLSKQFRYIFTEEEEEGEDILFPELHHGMQIVLEGAVTRGNASTNSMGFKYKEHILNCEPEKGSIVRFKASLFTQARIYGTVSRLDEKGKITAKRPKIIFSNIGPLESETKQPSLL